MSKRFIITERERKHISNLYRGLLFEEETNPLEVPPLKPIDSRYAELVLDSSYGTFEGTFKLQNYNEILNINEGDKLPDDDGYNIIYEKGSFKTNTPHFTIKDNKMVVPFNSVSELLQKLVSFENDFSTITDSSVKKLHETAMKMTTGCVVFNENVVEPSDDFNIQRRFIFMKDGCGGNLDYMIIGKDGIWSTRLKDNSSIDLVPYINGDNIQFEKENKKNQGKIFIDVTPTNPVSFDKTEVKPEEPESKPVDPGVKFVDSEVKKDTEEIIDGKGKDPWDYKKVTKADGTVEYYASINNKATWRKTKKDSAPYNAIKSLIFGD